MKMCFEAQEFSMFSCKSQSKIKRNSFQKNGHGNVNNLQQEQVISIQRAVLIQSCVQREYGSYAQQVTYPYTTSTVLLHPGAELVIWALNGDHVCVPFHASKLDGHPPRTNSLWHPPGVSGSLFVFAAVHKWWFARSQPTHNQGAPPQNKCKQGIHTVVATLQGHILQPRPTSLMTWRDSAVLLIHLLACLKVVWFPWSERGDGHSAKIEGSECAHRLDSTQGPSLFTPGRDTVCPIVISFALVTISAHF